MENIRKAIDMYNKLHKYLWDGYSSFLIREQIKKQIAGNVQWSEVANENVAICNMYKNFFIYTIHAHQTVFLLELAKLYDKDTQTVSLYNLLCYIENNIKTFNEENYKKYCQKYESDRQRDGEYTNIKIEDIRTIRDEILCSDKLIEKVKKIRDSSLAHNDFKKKDIPLIIQDVDELYQKTQWRLNKISYILNWENWFKISDKKNISNNIHSLFEALKRSNKYRKTEIEKQKQKEIEELRPKNL